jgi:hypothetical protein
VAALEARAELRLGAGKAGGRARIDELRRAARQLGPDRVEAAYQLGPETRGEPRVLLRFDRAAFDRSPLAQPFRQAAVEHRDGVVAHDAEHPPHPRRAHDAVHVVGEDRRPVAEPHGPDPRREFGRLGEHVRQGVAVVLDLVDIEEDRARNVPLGKFGARVARDSRQEISPIDDPDRGVVQALGEPLRRNQGDAFHLRLLWRLGHAAT